MRRCLDVSRGSLPRVVGSRGIPKRLLALFCALLLAAPSLAQVPATAPAQAPAQAQAQAPPLRVTTHLVQVNVIVQDKKGEPIADLKRDDFVLLDQGKPQEIRSFSVESLGMLPAPVQPQPANFYSNRKRRARPPA